MNLSTENIAAKNFAAVVGESDFASLRRENAFYVDKTEMIYELANNERSKVALFTRPRRFGKTLAMSMMENFFNIRKDSTDIFKGLDVCAHENFCAKWMNRYPVLFISFKDAESDTFETAYAKLKNVLADMCKNISDIDSNANVNPFDAQIFNRLKAQTGSESDVQNSLKTIMRMLHAVYDKKVILLIDEYDVPLAKANEKNTAENQYYERMLDLIKGIMSIALKDNEFLQFAAITGCLRLAKESVFMGTNNFASYSVLDEEFSQFFGFSDSEVRSALKAAGLSRKAETVKEWYDGYVFGNSYVYCPWDVVNYLSALNRNSEAQPKNYWKNTSHNGVLMTFVSRTDFDVSDKFETLLNGGTVTQTVTDLLTYDTLHSSEDNLWSVLLMTGYVTKANPDEKGDSVSLKIPNREIASIFEDTVVRYFRDNVSADSINRLMEALWSGDENCATDIISDLLWDTVSFHDYHENYYHAFLAGVFVGRGYSVESNKESGLGRPDILLKDRKNRRAVVIEAKKSAKESDMGKDCDKALEQIAAGKYAEGLDGYKQIMRCGAAFFRKRAKLKIRENGL